MVTKPVTLKAILRVCADLAAVDTLPEEGRVDRWKQRLAPWTEQARQFRKDGSTNGSGQRPGGARHAHSPGIIASGRHPIRSSRSLM